MEPFKVGDRVLVLGANQEGEILEIDAKGCHVVRTSPGVTHYCRAAGLRAVKAGEILFR